MKQISYSWTYSSIFSFFNVYAITQVLDRFWEFIFDVIFRCSSNEIEHSKTAKMIFIFIQFPNEAAASNENFPSNEWFKREFGLLPLPVTNQASKKVEIFRVSDVRSRCHETAISVNLRCIFFRLFRWLNPELKPFFNFSDNRTPNLNLLEGSDPWSREHFINNFFTLMHSSWCDLATKILDFQRRMK